MYPTVRSGDVLRIRSCAAAEVVAGDIAVCRTPDYLFSHRVIDRGELDGRAYIVTRSDRSRGGAMRPHSTRISSVSLSASHAMARRCRSRHRYPWVVRRCLGAHLALIEAKPRVRAKLIARRSRAGSLAVRPHCGSVAPPRAPTLRFTVRVPLNATLGDSVFRELTPEGFDPSAPWNGRYADRWTVAAFVNGADVSAGSIVAARESGSGWRLEEPLVRSRYRGTGLEGLLRQQAEAILDRCGRRGEEAGLG